MSDSNGSDWVTDFVLSQAALFAGLDIEKVTPDKSFREDLGLDSLDFVEMIMEIEEEFDLKEIQDSVVDKMKTLGDVIAYIHGNRDSGAEW